ncbi:serine/threonine-protein kinase [Polyangium aurulentum]|uniref:serine/threonine-protein kinase n=1 Tax=Polyangium aurulentum TaxID=2567896 RepID=UPI0010AE2CDB|nr:serine/threonine-protein kinase [Polyangium aurulentum]UQA56796.1 protein kinase [Polyangium aurulentum]
MAHRMVPNTIAAGDILAGKYRVERTLGMGGMGIVVAATHLDLHEVRAVKLMRADLDDPQIVERFLREARAVVKLRSEHVAQVHDVGRLPTGIPYIVMELLEGLDLAAVLKKRGTVPLREAVLFIMQACDALAEAHGRGIVHRDLKPANLFLTRREDGSPCIKVLDFGVSKVIHPDGECAEAEMTSNGDIMGSPLYMAPEQMRSAREVDARADIWALGSILYKLLTGRAPFQRPTVPEIFMAVMGHEPAQPPSTLRNGLPPGLDAVVMRCLEKDPALRFGRALDLKAALSPYCEFVTTKADDEPALSQDEPWSMRGATTTRPRIPKNIDAILLGCIGREPGKRAARASGRRHQSDPFLRAQSATQAEPRTVSEPPPPVEPVVAAPAPIDLGSTLPMSPQELRAAAQIPFGPTSASTRPSTRPPMPPVEATEEGTVRLSSPGDLKSAPPAAPSEPEGAPAPNPPMQLSPEEAAALPPPRVPSFPSITPSITLPSVTSSPMMGDTTGHSVAPWGYPSQPAPARRGRPLVMAASAATGAFVLVAALVAFTAGRVKEQAAASNGPRSEPPPSARTLKLQAVLRDAYRVKLPEPPPSEPPTAIPVVESLRSHDR